MLFRETSFPVTVSRIFLSQKKYIFINLTQKFCLRTGQINFQVCLCLDSSTVFTDKELDPEILFLSCLSSHSFSWCQSSHALALLCDLYGTSEFTENSYVPQPQQYCSQC